MKFFLITPARTLRRLLPMAGVASLIACGGGQQSPTPMPNVGTFDFAVLGGRGPVRGVVHILPDTVLVEVEHGFCHRMLGQGDAGYIRYDCDVRDYNAFGINFDRRNMSVGSTWSVSFTVTRTRRVCVEHDMNGRCIRYTTQKYEATQNQEGRLRLLPRPSTQPDSSPSDGIQGGV